MKGECRSGEGREEMRMGTESTAVKNATGHFSRKPIKCGSAAKDVSRFYVGAFYSL